jgi:hypothetical protein
MEQKYIRTTNGLITLVDWEDWYVYGSWPWKAVESSTKGKWYVVGGPAGSLHRAILKAPPGLEVDHINLDPLDNRRANLRLATGSQNQHNKTKRRDNTSGHKGVAWDKRSALWEVRVKVAGKQRFGGRFAELADAVAAASALRASLHGAFARD